MDEEQQRERADLLSRLFALITMKLEDAAGIAAELPRQAAHRRVARRGREARCPHNGVGNSARRRSCASSRRSVTLHDLSISLFEAVCCPTALRPKPGRRAAPETFPKAAIRAAAL
jgi:hypothetical protein